MEYVEAAAPIHQYLGEARGAHDWVDHEQVVPRVRNVIRVIPLVKGDGCREPLEPHWSGKGVDDVHLLLSDAVLQTGFVCLGALEDHEAMISLRKLSVIHQGSVHRLAGLRGRLLGLTLLVEGAMDVAPDGGTILEEVLCLPPMEGRGLRAPS